MTTRLGRLACIGLSICTFTGCATLIFDRYDKVDIKTSPTVGFAGHIPFLWNKYVDATATVGFNKWEITAKRTNPNYLNTVVNIDEQGNETTTTTPLTVPDDRLDRSFDVFNVVIEGGPEIGFPLYEDFDSQRLIKPYVQLRGIFIKTFVQGDANWKNKQAFGWSYVGGVRYSFDNISISGGLRTERVSWTPIYDPTEGDSDKNDLDMSYERNYKPWLAVEFSFY